MAVQDSRTIKGQVSELDNVSWVIQRRMQIHLRVKVVNWLHSKDESFSIHEKISMYPTIQCSWSCKCKHILSVSGRINCSWINCSPLASTDCNQVIQDLSTQIFWRFYSNTNLITRCILVHHLTTHYLKFEEACPSEIITDAGEGYKTIERQNMETINLREGGFSRGACLVGWSTMSLVYHLSLNYEGNQNFDAWCKGGSLKNVMNFPAGFNYNL